jgi:predicted nucleotidyltransferase
MKSWEDTLNKFLVKWKDRDDVVGAMVCGSYITGHPTDRSDLDVHIILSDEVDWRERGNQYVDGLLIEYFVNPPRQIREYFAEDYNGHNTMSMVQFITGKVIFDKQGIIEQLKKEAMEWKDKKYDDMDTSLKEIKKYGLWDSFDNLLDCFETQRKDFDFVYHQSLSLLFKEYCFFLNIEQIPFYQITRYLSDPRYLSKYLKAPFPDQEFCEMYLMAVETEARDMMIEIYEKLLSHVYEQTGGFNIDGWNIRTPVK